MGEKNYKRLENFKSTKIALQMSKISCSTAKKQTGNHKWSLVDVLYTRKKKGVSQWTSVLKERVLNLHWDWQTIVYFRS